MTAVVLSEEPRSIKKYREEMNYYVYILTNEYNKVLYIGVTNNLSRRLKEHTYGTPNGFTMRYKAHKLIYAEQYTDIKAAIKREKQLKGFKREKKVELITTVNPLWDEIIPPS